MKKILSIVMTLVLVLGFSMTALAEGFAITLNHIGDANDTLYYTSFSQNYTVTGTVTYPTKDSNNGIVIDNQSIKLKLYVSTTVPTFNENGKLNMTPDVITLADDEKSDNKISRNNIVDGSFDFSFNWAIDAPNTYYVIAQAKKAGDYVEVWETVIVQQITATYPAAPAVAADILKSAGVKPKYNGGNYISDVADFMGPRTSFRDVATDKLIEKSDVENYRTAVYNYLVQLGALD